MAVAQPPLRIGPEGGARDHRRPHPSRPDGRARAPPPGGTPAHPRRDRAPVVARRVGHCPVGRAAVGHRTLGAGRRPRGARLPGRTAHQHRPPDRAHRLGSAAGAGAPHGQGPVAGAGLGAGRPRPAPPHRGVHLVQPDVGAHRAHRPRVRRSLTAGPVGHHRRPRPRVPGDAPRRRWHRRPVPGGGDVGEEGPGEAALRVVAPGPPLRLSRCRARAATPVLDRPGVPHLDARHGVLVGSVCRGRGCRARLADGGPLWRSLRSPLVVSGVRPRAQVRRR